MKRAKFWGALVVLSLALAGCNSTPAPSSPTSTATPPRPTSTSPAGASTPAPVDSPAIAEPDHVVVSAVGMQVVLDDGTLGLNIDYFQPIDEVAIALTELLGAEPSVTSYPDTPAADYVWEGLTLLTDGPAQPPRKAEFVVRVTAPDVHGLSMETADGVKVGSPIGPIEAANPASSHRGTIAGQERLSIYLSPVSIENGDSRTFSVEVVALPSDGPVSEIFAPAKDFE